MPYPLAIQSWCFREFKPLPDFFKQLKAAGVSATEVCNVHANFTDTSTFAKTVGAFKAAGVAITSIGIEGMTGDDAKDRPRFEFCKAARVKMIGISFAPDVFFDGKLKNVEKLADEFDINVGIHNHGGYDWLGNPTILKHVFSKTSSRVGLHLDTAWAMDAKQNPVQMAEQFIDRLHGVHVKDFVFDRAREPEDVIIGTGNLNLPALMKLLKGSAFSGPVVIEYEKDAHDPAAKLRQCVDAITPLL